MAIILAGLYRIDLFQDYLGEEVLNTFWYRETGGSNIDAAALNLAFDAAFIPPLSVMQNGDVTYTNLRCQPIFGTGIEDNRATVVAGGTKGGTSMSTFMAASLKLNRATNELRNGWKRFCGLTEEEVGAQSFAGALTTDLNAMGAVLDNVLVSGPLVFQPVIVRKPFSTLAQTANWEFTDLASTTTLNRPTTQSSRKTF